MDVFKKKEIVVVVCLLLNAQQHAIVSYLLRQLYVLSH